MKLRIIKPGAGEQHDRERQLGDDHRAAEPARAPAAGGASPAFLQHVVDDSSSRRAGPARGRRGCAVSTQIAATYPNTT